MKITSLTIRHTSRNAPYALYQIEGRGKACSFIPRLVSSSLSDAKLWLEQGVIAHIQKSLKHFEIHKMRAEPSKHFARETVYDDFIDKKIVALIASGKPTLWREVDEGFEILAQALKLGKKRSCIRAFRKRIIDRVGWTGADVHESGLWTNLKVQIKYDRARMEGAWDDLHHGRFYNSEAGKCRYREAEKREALAEKRARLDQIQKAHRSSQETFYQSDREVLEQSSKAA